MSTCLFFPLAAKWASSRRRTLLFNGCGIPLSPNMKRTKKAINYFILGVGQFCLLLCGWETALKVPLCHAYLGVHLALETLGLTLPSPYVKGLLNLPVAWSRKTMLVCFGLESQHQPASVNAVILKQLPHVRELCVVGCRAVIFVAAVGCAEWLQNAYPDRTFVVSDHWEIP